MTLQINVWVLRCIYPFHCAFNIPWAKRVVRNPQPPLFRFSTTAEKKSGLAFVEKNYVKGPLFNVRENVTLSPTLWIRPSYATVYPSLFQWKDYTFKSNIWYHIDFFCTVSTYRMRIFSECVYVWTLKGYKEMCGGKPALNVDQLRDFCISATLVYVRTCYCKD